MKNGLPLLISILTAIGLIAMVEISQQLIYGNTYKVITYIFIGIISTYLSFKDE